MTVSQSVYDVLIRPAAIAQTRAGDGVNGRTRATASDETFSFTISQRLHFLPQMLLQSSSHQTL